MRAERRWLERGKDALIILLALSALYLLSMTPLVQDSGVLELLRPPEPAGSGTAASANAAAAVPARMAVNAPAGRYGLQYDQAALDEALTLLSPLLGEALASAWETRAVTERQWREYLGRTGIYFDFSGQIPLNALGGWLRGAGDCLLDGSARRLLLAADGEDDVLLCWQDEAAGAYYVSSTALTQRLHLDPAVEDYTANGAYFAFEDGDMAQWLEPYTLIAEGAQGVRTYTVSDPLAAPEGVEALLEALSFSGRDHAAVSGGEAYLDGDDRLVIAGDGTVTYRTARPEKYPAGTAQPDGSPSQAVEAAWALAERSIGASCGEARLCLTQVEEAAGGWRVCFGYRLDAAAVRVGDAGWAAEFWIWDGYIVKFTLQARCYTDTGEEVLLLPIDRAAALLPELTHRKVELAIQYQDRGGGTVDPEWVIVEEDAQPS